MPGRSVATEGRRPSLRQRLDPDERRRQIVEALWRLTLRQGLSSVSFRDVAREAGVSVTLVQYYFGTKARLLTAAVQQLGARIVERGLSRMTASGDDREPRRVPDEAPADPMAEADDPTGLARKATADERSPRSVIHAALMGALPTDDESRADMLLFLTFYIASLTDPQLAGTRVLSLAQWTMPFFAELIRMAQATGDVSRDVDPDAEAVTLLATLTGLGLMVVGEMRASQDAVAAIEYSLGRLFRR